MSAYDPKQLQAVTAAAAPDLDLTFKPMFGGIMAYVGGAPFASLSNVGLALKLKGEDRDAMLAVEGAAALRYEPGSPPSKSYIVVPRSMLEDTATLHAWILRSAVALAAKSKKAAQE